MRPHAPALAAVPWDLVVADEAQHVKNPQSSTARALRTIPSAARVALTGTPVENNLTELWAILDWATPGLLGSRGAFRKVWAGPIESGLEPTKARQFADLIGPFLLRRRKSDPGVAPELPAKTETDHVLGLTREQVVLYEAFVRDTMERIERADEETRRGLVLALLTGLKQICNHPAQFLKQASPRLGGPLAEAGPRSTSWSATVIAEDGAVLVFTQYVAMARLLDDAPDPHRRRPPVPARRHPGARARGDGGPLPGRRGPGLPAVAARGRHRPQPDPGRPRDPPGPLVEPRGRGAGDRPGLPDRPDPAGPGAPAGHPGHHRGAHRRAAHPQARAGRLGAGRPRRSPRSPSSATPTCATWSPCAPRPEGGWECGPIHRRQPPRRGGRARALVGQGVGARGRGVGVRRGGPARGAHAGPVRTPRADHHRPRRRRLRRLDGDRLLAVTGALAALDDASLDAFVELVAAESGRIADLLAGDLPLTLVEHAEEAGVELLPYAGDFAWACSCDAWLDPCPHALAVRLPAGLAGRRGPVGAARPARAAARRPARPAARPQVGRRATGPDDLELALDAALRAGRALELLAAGEPIDHLL